LVIVADQVEQTVNHQMGGVVVEAEPLGPRLGAHRFEGEHDVNGGPLIREEETLGLIADARAPIEQLEEFLGKKILPDQRDDDVDTLGGLVFTLLGRVPVRGEIVPHVNGIEFEVLDADPRRIKKLRIHQKDREEPGPGAAPGDGA